MPSRMCAVCGKPYAGASCPRCGHAKRKSPSRRTVEQERARKTSNPWRKQYSSLIYKRARQAALESTNGCCAVSGVRIADKVNGRWVMRPNGGVHHIKPLSAGGTNSIDNLVPLDVSVHNRIDAERRRREER